LQITTDGIGAEAVATAGTPLTISGQIISQGEPVIDSNYSIELTPLPQFAPITLNGLTDSNGDFSHAWSDWLDFETENEVLKGDITVEITYSGGEWGLDSQQVSGSTAIDSFTAKTAATLSVNPSILQLDSNGQGVITVQLIADNSIEQSLLTGIAIEYEIGNETNQATGDTASLPVNSQGQVDVAISYPVGGEFDVTVLTQHTWLVLSNGAVRATLLPPPVSDEPEENETETPELLPLNWTCEDDLWEVIENGSSVTKTCTVGNPNSVLVHAEILISGPSGVNLDVIPTSATIFSNASKDIQITLEAPLGTTIDNYSLAVEILVSAAGYNDITVVDSIDFVVLTQQIIGDGSGGEQNPPSDNDPKGSGMSTILMAGIAAAMFAILLVGFVVLRRLRGEDDYDEEDLFDEYDEFGGYADFEVEDNLATGKPHKRKVLHTPAGMRDKPKEWAMDDSGLPYTGSKAGTRPSSRRQKPKPVDIPLEEEEEEEDYDDEDSDEFDYTQSSDYKIDDDGVEWWKDELDVWWYRYPEEEEWSEFIE
jgi:hypothetical protein